MSRPNSRRRSQSTLHQVIREELAARHWTMSQLAEAIGVKVGVVSRWLTDGPKRVVPLPQMCVQIAEALNLDVIEVFRLAGYLPMSEPQSPSTHPHIDEIRTMQRLLARMLVSIPDEQWPLVFPVVVVYLDGLQAIINRLDGHT